MAANKSQLTRIFNTIDAGTITVVLKSRENDGIAWKDAEVILTDTFNTEDIPAMLTNGNGSVSPHCYGIWKALSERTSDFEVTDKIAGMRDTFDQFKTGVWKSAAAPRSATLDVFFVQAVADLQSWSLPQAQAALTALDKDQRKALRAGEKVHKRIQELQLEAQSVDTGALSELM